MTEDEAKTKWCPLARVIPVRISKNGTSIYEPGYNSFNRFEKSVPMTASCIGSACMAWRALPRGRGKELERRPASAEDKNPGPDWYHVPVPGQLYGDWVLYGLGEPRGYCGAFGRGELDD